MFSQECTARHSHSSGGSGTHWSWVVARPISLWACTPAGLLLEHEVNVLLLPHSIAVWDFTAQHPEANSILAGFSASACASSCSFPGIHSLGPWGIVTCPFRMKPTWVWGSGSGHPPFCYGTQNLPDSAKGWSNHRREVGHRCEQWHLSLRQGPGGDSIWLGKFFSRRTLLFPQSHTCRNPIDV